MVLLHTAVASIYTPFCCLAVPFGRIVLWEPDTALDPDDGFSEQFRLRAFVHVLVLVCLMGCWVAVPPVVKPTGTVNLVNSDLFLHAPEASVEDCSLFTVRLEISSRHGLGSADRRVSSENFAPITVLFPAKVLC